MHRLSALMIALIALALPAGAAAADESDAARGQAERLVHLLGYLDADYTRTGPREWREHRALAAEAERLARGLPARIDLAARVADLRGRIERLESAADVHARAAELRTALAGAYHLDQAPHAPPDLAHGRALYEKCCATCHGMTGQADTPMAATLRPKPMSFRRSLFGDTVSPYDVTTAIQFGVDGTAMAAQPALSETDRWDIAFYVLGFPHPGPIALDAPGLTLAELARDSDEALRVELLGAGTPRVDADPVVAALRRRIPFEGARAGWLSRTRTDLDAARVAIERGEREAARRAVREAERRGLWPAAMALDRADPGAREIATKAFASLGERLASDTPDASPAELGNDIAGALRAVTVAERVLDRAYRHRRFAWCAQWAALFVARAGLLAALALGALFGGGVRASRDAERATPRDGPSARDRAIHLGWGGAVAGALAAGLGPKTTWSLRAALDGRALGTMWLLAACALLYALARPKEGRAWVLGVIAFAATWAGAFYGATMLGSLIAVGVPVRAVMLGTAAAGVALALVCWAAAQAHRRWLSARRTRIAPVLLGGAACGATVAFGAVLTTSEQQARASEPPATQASVAWPPDAPDTAAWAGVPPANPAACSGPGFDPGPELHAVAGLPPFDVKRNCMFPHHAELDVTVELRKPERYRDPVHALLNALLAQVREGEGEGNLPDSTTIRVVGRAAVVDPEKPVGRIRFDTDEGPKGELNVDFNLPFEPHAWAKELAERAARLFVGSRKPEITVDDAKREFRFVYPYLDRGGEGWEPHLDYAEALIALVPLLEHFYPAQTDYTAVTLVGVWKEKPVLTVHVPDLAGFVSLDYWNIRQRMVSAGIPVEPGAARTPDQKATLAREYALALAKLPKGSSVVDDALSRD